MSTAGAGGRHEHRRCPIFQAAPHACVFADFDWLYDLGGVAADGCPVQRMPDIDCPWRP